MPNRSQQSVLRACVPAQNLQSASAGRGSACAAAGRHDGSTARSLLAPTTIAAVGAQVNRVLRWSPAPS